MIWRALADLVVMLHFGFVLFVAVGGLLVLRHRRAVWVHLPAALWGAAIEFGGWTCPLTPLEKSLRAAGHAAGYEGGFIEHYIVAVLYPSGLTRPLQLMLGAAVVVSNLVFYWLAFRRRPAVQSSVPSAF
ncbi:MAG: DUF2784 domain-containing protein [Gemmatimonadales bacterium]|nr:DUF2784 domain-containing protein [Gemmatimonadales bacterium]